MFDDAELRRIEAGYAAGVPDSKEAIRRAGFLIEGDD